ncbi:Uncharacterised protein [Mycolicibacterium fortuitum]|uniref:Uncharacterized protein n=1 Tax=Mycolicibacterium fortuitum TaxID=1766 RepID=A0A378UZX7_MYCFO|nr:Uncharacterised protein [Mycolicibacterium fortuitum]
MKYRLDGRGRLVCDKCGQSGDTQERTCPYTVLGNSLNGPRVALPYCIAPALCEDCYDAAGGRDGIHGDRCRDGAAASQAEADQIEAQLDAGESFAVDAVGDWDATVPTGMVGVTFVGRAGNTYRLIPAAAYPNRRVALSEMESMRWTNYSP